MELINLIFESFWHFVGATIILSGVGNFLFLIWNRFWRHWNIREYGYPPKWCDADGDLRELLEDAEKDNKKQSDRRFKNRLDDITENAKKDLEERTHKTGK